MASVARLGGLVLIAALGVGEPVPAQSGPPGRTEGRRIEARRRPPGANHIGRAFEFVPVAEGVWQAVGTGTMGVGSNAAIIVNETDVLVVDSHTSPAAAWVLLDELRRITPKPVRYAVTTHFHYDHAHGNQIYGPEVEIIGHEFTREMMASGASRRGPAYDGFVSFVAARIAELRRQVDTTADPKRRAEARGQLLRYEQQRIADRAVVPTPPTLTLNDRLTLVRGGREIQILFAGRGHTGGDVVVYLPKEKILVTGDLLQPRLPYLGDGFAADWIETLGRLEALDVAAFIPGHGAWFSDRSVIGRLQAFLRDFLTQGTAAYRAGLPVPEAVRRMDFRAHLAGYPQLADTADTYDRLTIGLTRLYQTLERRP
ncbi:MAG: MBL fold metallo-hydrolase [Gemmatimonadales bacterium]|nr:MBL fold metallo-hydrolase [Gemmatimonadales bacterium]